MRTLQQHWNLFQENVLSLSHSEETVALLKGAFYAGAVSTIAIITDHEDDEPALARIYNDLHAYAVSVDGLSCPTAH